MSDQKLGPDNWLHILSHAFTNYVAEGGQVTIAEVTGELQVTLTAVSLTDGRLHPKFRALAATLEMAGNENSEEPLTAVIPGEG